VLKASRSEEASAVAAREPWYRSIWLGRVLAVILVIAALVTLSLVLVRYVG
jgi:hypothetical protein